MSRWASTNAQKLLAALLRMGWAIKRQHGTSHRVLTRLDWPDYIFSFHDRETIGPKILARIVKHPGLTPKDL